MSLLFVSFLSGWLCLFAQNPVMRQREEQVVPVRRKVKFARSTTRVNARWVVISRRERGR